jgi:hypothetical protein
MQHQDLSIRRLIENAIDATFSDQLDFIGQNHLGQSIYITTPPDKDYYSPGLKANWDTFYNYRPFVDYMSDNLPATVQSIGDQGWQGWMVSEFSGRKIPVITTYYQGDMVVTFVPPDRYGELRAYASEKSAYLLIKQLRSVPQNYRDN